MRPLVSVLLLAAIISSPLIGHAQVLLQERFDNANLGARGWYDGTVNPNIIDTSEHIPGSTSSMRFRWPQGATKPVDVSTYRHAIPATDRVYLSYWIKHSSNWVGSGRAYHPHVFYFLNDLEGAYTGPAFTRLTAYVEEVQGFPVLAIQDGVNVDKTKLNVDLSNTTEDRAIAGCNGVQSVQQKSTSCYPSGSNYWNGITWNGPSADFLDPAKKTQWNFVEAYFQLNTIANGKGQPNGIVRMWLNGSVVIDRTNVILRTAKNATMRFNQFIIGPWIGDGSPVDQTFWIDELTIATERPAPSAKKPSAPMNLESN